MQEEETNSNLCCIEPAITTHHVKQPFFKTSATHALCSNLDFIQIFSNKMFYKTKINILLKINSFCLCQEKIIHYADTPVVNELTYTAWGSLNLPTCWIWYMRSPPVTYSITKYRRSCRNRRNRRGEGRAEKYSTYHYFAYKICKVPPKHSNVSTYLFTDSAACPSLAVWVIPSFLLHFPWQGDLKSPQQSASWKKKTLNTDICQEVFSLSGPSPPMTRLAWSWSRSVWQLVARPIWAAKLTSYQVWPKQIWLWTCTLHLL